LVLIVDRVLLIAAIRSRSETAAGRLFAGSLFIAGWHRVRRGFSLVPPSQVVVQKIGRGIRLQIRRSAPPSRFIMHGLAPIVVSGTNAAPFTMFLAPDDLGPIGTGCTFISLTAYAVRGEKGRYAVLKRLLSQNQPGPNNRAIGLKSPYINSHVVACA
jgi:hypothetical protein